MRSCRRYSKLLFALLVAAFAYFVWPTRYAYFMSCHPGGAQAAMRVDRFTGRADMLAYDGWRHYERDAEKQGETRYPFRHVE